MDKNYEKQVAVKIGKLRAQAGLTQEEMCAKLQLINCNMTRSALAKIEVGQRHVYLDELRAIKEVFKVTYDEILND